MHLIILPNLLALHNLYIFVCILSSYRPTYLLYLGHTFIFLDLSIFLLYTTVLYLPPLYSLFQNSCLVANPPKKNKKRKHFISLPCLVQSVVVFCSFIFFFSFLISTELVRSFYSHSHILFFLSSTTSFSLLLLLIFSSFNSGS